MPAKKTLGQHFNVASNEELWKIIDKDRCIEEGLPVNINDFPPKGGKTKYPINYHYYAEDHTGMIKGFGGEWKWL